MGYQSTVVINNDMLAVMEQYPEEFCKRLAGLIRSFGAREPSYYGPAKVVSVAHADELSVMLVGNLTAQNMGLVEYGKRYSNPLTEEDKIEIVKRLADQLGFSLRKKPAKDK